VVAAFAIQETGDWTWPFWEMFFASLFTLILLSFSLPETSKDTILLRKAARLRKITGNNNLRALSEIQQAHLSVSEALFDALVRPITMTFTEPIIIAVNLYNGLIYAVMYSFFKSFPLVYGEGGYGWNLGVSTLPFLGLVVGEGLGVGGYALWNW
jgi:DHA1 family multidrug resistance protein-like MFS transporter